jgi:hypothetical protein
VTDSDSRRTRVARIDEHPAPGIPVTPERDGITSQRNCGHVGPLGKPCIDDPGHDGSHSDGSIYRWITR